MKRKYGRVSITSISGKIVSAVLQETDKHGVWHDVRPLEVEPDGTVTLSRKESERRISIDVSGALMRRLLDIAVRKA